MYVGRFQCGEYVSLALLCATSANVPVAPDAAPTADVYSGEEVVTGLKLPVLDPQAVTGLFMLRLFLDDDFAPGTYTVVFRWLVSAVPHQKTATFEVGPGGDASGAVHALAYYHRPHCEFLVNQRAGGGVWKGKSPRI